MFVLSGEFDQITGARIATALTAKERQLWHREDPNARATPQQRMADALAELICETASGGSVSTDLLVIADFDVLEQQLENPRLADGSPIPMVELHRLALEANLLPAIFNTEAQDMWLGRRQRAASEAQRVALIARDQGCIGCGANPLWCRAHHIIWWSHNGPTDLNNFVLVCDDCHHKIHDHGWQVHKQPSGRHQLKPPDPAHAADARATQPRWSSPATKSRVAPMTLPGATCVLTLPANSATQNRPTRAATTVTAYKTPPPANPPSQNRSTKPATTATAYKTPPPVDPATQNPTTRSAATQQARSSRASPPRASRSRIG